MAGAISRQVESSQLWYNKMRRTVRTKEGEILKKMAIRTVDAATAKTLSLAAALSRRYEAGTEGRRGLIRAT